MCIRGGNHVTLIFVFIYRYIYKQMKICGYVICVYIYIICVYTLYTSKATEVAVVERASGRVQCKPATPRNEP